MKSPLLTAIAGMLLVSTATVAIDISGATVYQQSFDTLPTAASLSEFDWGDNFTIRGFYLHRSNTPSGEFSLAQGRYDAGDRPYVADGSVVPNGSPNYHGFLSLGAYNSADRALGFCPTGTDGSSNWSGGTLSIIALFTNTAARPVEITQIAYSLENRRANSNSTPETITLTYKTGPAAALLAELSNKAASSTFSLPGYQPVNGGSFAYTSANGFASPAIPGTTLRSGTLTSTVWIAPGDSAVLRWENNNDGGTDAVVGLDDLSITFAEVTSFLSPEASNISRSEAGTPRVPTDDSVTFDLLIPAAPGTGTTGWTITAPAALAGVTGTYGVNRAVPSVPISAFNATTHTLSVSVRDRTNTALAGAANVTAPWCVITPVISNMRRTAGQNAFDPSDDNYSFNLTVDAQFGGTGFSELFYGPFPGSWTGTYGTVYELSTSFGILRDLVLQDNADSSCTAQVSNFLPHVIGTNFLQNGSYLLSAARLPAAWTVDESQRTQSLNGTSAPGFYSEELDLSAVGEVYFEMELLVTDTSSGFESSDTFSAVLIFDGDEEEPLNLTAPYDILEPRDGFMNGAELTPRVAGTPPVSGPGTFTHRFSAMIPADVNSVRLAVRGSMDSASERLTVRNVRFAPSSPAIYVTPAADPVFSNRGTVTPDDDEFRQAVTITPILLPPSSTGWTSDALPASGLYSAANPVTLGPLPLREGSRTITLRDSSVPAAQGTVTLSPPAISFPEIEQSSLRATRNTQNTADPGDDTLTITFRIRSRMGGPQFSVSSPPSTVLNPNPSLTTEYQNHTLTFSHVPSSGMFWLFIRDASYPNTELGFRLDPSGVAVPRYVMARKDLGSGVTNVLTPAGAATPSGWSNYPSLPAMRFEGPGTNISISSENVDLSGVTGPVYFTASFRHLNLWDGSTRFRAELILDDDSAHPVLLAAPWDTDASGAMNGNEFLLSQGGVFPLNAVIPDEVNYARLVLTGSNSSLARPLFLEGALFKSGSPPPIAPGGYTFGIRGAGVSGKFFPRNLILAATGGGGPLSVSAVQAGPTAGGGGVSLEEGWIAYQPAPGFSGTDTFTYTLTDGTQTATGTVTVVISPSIDTPFAFSFVREGEGNRIAGWGIPGRSYQWQFTSNLSRWTPLGAPQACPAHGAMSILDPGPLPPSRFYRMIETSPQQ